MPEGVRRRKVKGESVALDAMHIVIGIAVVAMAVVSFISPEENMFFFPVIFLMAAVLNLVSGRFRMKRSKSHGQRAAAILEMLFGITLAVLAAVSAVSIWWR
ncbi:MAG: hypothetical protein HFE83_00020 [Lachnospiraceae bacterium]|jgi:uncharacterized membrane protein HdeD (DUF308 family)|nr:hypothetical protein [Lachnospiraceae bacterium]